MMTENIENISDHVLQLMPAGLIALMALGMFGRYSLTIYQVSSSLEKTLQTEYFYIFLGRTEVITEQDM